MGFVLPIPPEGLEEQRRWLALIIAQRRSRSLLRRLRRSKARIKNGGRG